MRMTSGCLLIAVLVLLAEPAWGQRSVLRRTPRGSTTSPPAENPDDLVEITLQQRVQRVLDFYYQRPEDAAVRSPWGVMHSLISYGVETQLLVDGQQVNAIGWLCWNQPCRGFRLLERQEDRVVPGIGVDLQGHQGQFLAMLAQSKVRDDYPIRVDGEEFLVRDLVRSEQLACQSGTELTFQLIGLAHYLSSDQSWENAEGEKWDLPRMLREEMEQTVIQAACGGTHRLMGLSYAVDRRRKQGAAIDGEWQRAQTYVRDFQEYAFELQNENGSFSTDWLKARGDAADRDLYLQTSGHVLEWLVFSLSPEQLREPRVENAVTFLADLLWDNRYYQWSVGPKGHALHALVLYDQRVFGAQPGTRLTDASSRSTSEQEPTRIR